MVDQKNKENIDGLEIKTERSDSAMRPEQEVGDIPESKERASEDEMVSVQLRKEIEMMKLDPATEKDAEAKKEKIEFLDEKEKIEHLLKMARKKGVVFAIQVARKMNDPYLLDILHDTLSQEGFYKDFSK